MSLPTKEGHLFKYKSFPRKWSYRYFKLNRTYLQFYETQHSLHPKGNIVRSEITSVETCTTFTDRVYVFTIATKGGDKWHVSAADESEMEDWIRDLRAHLPPSIASGTSKSSKEKVPAKDDGRPSSPTYSAPPLPGYMAAQMAADHPPDHHPPSYEAACTISVTDKSRPL